MLAVLDELETALSPKGEIKGGFRLGVSPYLSKTETTTIAEKLSRESLQFTLRVITGWLKQLLERIRRSEIDVAAVCLPHGLEPPTEIEADAFDVQPLFVAASPSLSLPSPSYCGISRRFLGSSIKMAAAFVARYSAVSSKTTFCASVSRH